MMTMNYRDFRKGSGYLIHDTGLTGTTCVIFITAILRSHMKLWQAFQESDERHDDDDVAHDV